MKGKGYGRGDDRGARRDAALLAALLSIPGMASDGEQVAAARVKDAMRRGVAEADGPALRWLVIEAAARLAAQQRGPSG